MKNGDTKTGAEDRCDERDEWINTLTEPAYPPPVYLFHRFRQCTARQEIVPKDPAAQKITIIKLKERNLEMLKKDLILRNPLRLMGHENEEIIPVGGFAAVLARHGVGKTALIVQLALNTLIKNKKVLHVSLNDPVDKVNLWYREVFNCLANQYNVKQVNDLWEDTLPNRFIMTFKVEGFSVPKLEERLADLTEQNIFKPDMLIVDGIPFDGTLKKPLTDLKEFAGRHNLQVWFTVTTHRHQEPCEDGLPIQMDNISDLFDAIIQLQPEGNKIHINALKGSFSKDAPKMQILDPSTMLIQNVK